jgi:hypothetical protein
MPCRTMGSPKTMAADEQPIRSRVDAPRTESVEQHHHLPAVAREIQESTEEALRRREQAHRARASAAGQLPADAVNATRLRINLAGARAPR